MKKGFAYYIVLWIILFIVFNVFCFATPSELNEMYKYGGAFWAGYVFIVISMISELICGYIAFGAGSRQKIYYNISLVKKSYSFMILMMIVGTVCMIIPDIPNWIASIICGILLSLNVISLVKAYSLAEIISEKDVVIKQKTYFIRTLTIDSELLLNRCYSPDIAVIVKKVYEEIRYSDPVSNDKLSFLEEEILGKFNLFKQAAESNNIDIVEDISCDLLTLISERNKICKLSK